MADDPNKADLSALAPASGAAPPPPKPDDSGDKPGDAPKPNSEAHGADVDKAAGISTAKGKGEGALGDQVDPATQTSEADGHRTLMKPVTDPGPYVRDGAVNVKNPDRSKGEHRFGDANEDIPILQRKSTGHDLGFAHPAGDTHAVTAMAPDLAISGAASDCYHPSNGKETSLTADAEAKANAQKELAPLHE